MTFLCLMKASAAPVADGAFIGRLVKKGLFISPYFSLWASSSQPQLWAGLARCLPKNGNNRPLSLMLENFFPTFLFCALKAPGSGFLHYVISSPDCYRWRQERRKKKETMRGLRSRMNGWKRQEDYRTPLHILTIYDLNNPVNQFLYGECGGLLI